MSMFKKSFVLFVAMMTFWAACTTCRAEIRPAYGPGQIGLTSSVLCESLPVHKEASADSEKVQELKAGDRIMVMEQQDGWAHIAVSDAVDAEPPGWVKTDFLAIDPAWYKTEDTTLVYAWNDLKANKVAEVQKDTELPILKDDGEWVVVGINGASGWIHKTDAEIAELNKKNSEETKKASEENKTTAGESKKTAAADDSFTVYAEDGSTAVIHLAEGTMYADEKGRTYSNIRGDMYYCIETDTTYAADPNVWVNGEPTPDDADDADDVDDVDDVDDDDDDDDVDDVDDTDDDGWTGADFGENPDYVYEDEEEAEG